MKKIFSIVLALGLMTGAYALPFTGITRSLEQKDARTIVAKQSRKVQPMERLDLTQLPIDKVPLAMQSNTVRATKRQAGTPITVNDTIDGAFMLYLYNYYYYMKGSDIGNAWELQVTCRNGLELWLDFNTVADNRIEGFWHNVAGMGIMGADTFDVSGVLDINYKSAGEEGFSPVYTFEGQFVDGSGNTYNLAGDYAFAEDGKDGEVIDYYFYYCCIGYKIEEACPLVGIYLVDEPVIPSGESVDLTISNAANKAFYADEGGWYVTAKDADAFASFQVYSTELKGSFTTKDLDYTYTSLVSFADGDTTEIDIYKPLSLDITEKNDTSFYDLSMLGMDGVTYNVTMFYPNPVITDTIDIRLQGELKFLGTDGIYIAEAYDANLDTVVFLGLNTKTITGTFTELNFYGGNSNNQIAFRGEKNYTIYYEDKATIKLDSLRGQDGQADIGYYVCTMLIDGYNANDRKDSHCFRVNLLLRNPYEGQAEKNLTVTLEADPTQLFDTTDFAQYGFIRIKYYDTTSCYFYTVAYPEQCDKDYMLPLGTYTFSNKREVGTMLQSAGWDEEWYPTYSFYQDATTKDTWFMFAGTATMTENSLIFNAVNLNEDRIKITINFVTSGIEEVMQTADQLQLKKVMENGNLYIIRDKKAYNAAGFRIK